MRAQLLTWVRWKKRLPHLLDILEGIPVSFSGFFSCFSHPSYISLFLPFLLFFWVGVVCFSIFLLSLYFSPFFLLFVWLVHVFRSSYKYHTQPAEMGFEGNILDLGQTDDDLSDLSVVNHLIPCLPFVRGRAF